ncbi:RagB/SusD family nutrient uptake outer membrane protein [Parasediminibacterium sp. JCM 36343]|uniref:RagB/SusD family nutrient uptake outer membrane protein n=1 Tax=Parasediminibacterium sp. JCM 36343 TaxID=3374279 RepID=UPI00397A2517
MKNIVFIISFIMLVSLGLTSCKKFLTETTYSVFNQDNFPKTTADLRSLCNGMYNLMEVNDGYGLVIYELTDLFSDQLYTYGLGGSRADFENLTVSPSNTEILKWWQRSYAIIGRANIIIQAAPTSPLTPAQIAPFVAEAKFIRAMTYFQMVKFWGDVPLITQTFTDLDSINAHGLPYRTGQDTVYKQIISDLLEAEQYLPDEKAIPSTYKGLPSNGAASSLLAKVYLTRAYLPIAEATDFQNAAAESQKIMNNPNYSLYTNYADVFDVNKENGSEHIFCIQFDYGSGLLTSTLAAYLTPTSVFPKGFGSFLAERPFYNSYTAKDTIRRNATYWDKGVGQAGPALGLPYNFVASANGQPYCGKYKDPVLMSNASNDRCNHIILRLADVLLMNSEALNRINPTDPNKYNGINKVRARVKLDTLTNIPDVTKFETAILQERGWELAFEAKRRDDMIRLGRLVQVMTADKKPQVQDYMKYYPIPQTERDLNPSLTQNLGY